MAESRDAHVVEIPVDGEGPRDRRAQEEEEEEDGGPCVVQPGSAAVSAMELHPLTQISQSPGHLLLLKLWQREEDLFGRRIGARETRLEGTKRDVFRLCCLFLFFHGLFLTLLFAGSVDDGRRARATAGEEACAWEKDCRDWWVPCCLSLLTSLVLVCAVQVRLCGFWEATRQLQRERGDARALARCVQELRMKGASFDLCREPVQGARRVKSSSVQATWWRPLRWCRRNLVTICLLCSTSVAVPACKLILCG